MMSERVMGRPRKLPADKYRRVTLMVSADANDMLRRLAEERFLGNLSRAAAWSIGLAAATLDGPWAGLQMPLDPSKAVGGPQ